MKKMMTTGRCVPARLLAPMLGVGVAVLLCGPARGQASEPPPEPPPAEQPPPDPVPDLDELLGTGGEKKPEREEAAAPPQGEAKSELQRRLSAEEMQQMLREAVRQMGETADRLQSLRDAGLVTQRLQEDIVRKLDALIRSQQQGGGSPSSGSQSSQSQQSPSRAPNQPQSGDPSASDQQNGGSGGGAVNTRFQQGQRSVFDTASAGWGALPERVRELLLQGSSDYFSAMYKAQTEAYYRKVAEEATDR